MPTFSDAVLNRRNFSIATLTTVLSACGGESDSDDSSSAGIALAQGALSKLSYDQTAVGFGSAGDIFVWDRGPSSAQQYPMRLIRLTSDGTLRPLLGSKQALDLKSPWRVSVLEHSNGSIYISESYATVFGLNTYAGNYGKIHRITPEGAHSVIYDAATSAISITPLVLAEGPGGRLYTLHVNTVSLYEIPDTGIPSLVSGLTTEPVINLSMVFAIQPYLNMALTRGGGVFISNIHNSTEPFFKFKNVAGMCAIGDYVYALIKEENGYMSLMRRNPNGSTQRIAGGVAASESGDPQPGPLTGSLGGGAIRLVGVMPDGSVVLGRSAFSGYSPEDYKYVSYFVVTPPKA